MRLHSLEACDLIFFFTIFRIEHPFFNRNGYNGLRPWMILISITMIAATSNIWIKLPTKPSENPNNLFACA
jgi:hypothetical protein